MQNQTLPLDQSGHADDTATTPDAAKPGASEGSPEPTSSGSAEPEPEAEAPKIERLPVKLEADEGGVQAILPRDLEQTFKMAKGIISSGIVPRAFRYSKRDADNGLIPEGKRKGDPNEALIVMGIMKSMEIGLAPLTGLSYLLPINDRFTIWGDAAVGLAQSKGLVAKQFHDTIGPPVAPTTELADWPDEYGHEVRIFRKGQESPYVGRYTVGDAKRARLWMNSDKEPWLKYPDRMLFNRARAFALRDGFADAFMGLAITEEARDAAPEPVDGGDLAPKKRGLLDDEE